MKLFNFIFKNKKIKLEDSNVSESVKEKIISAARVCDDDLKTEKNKIFEIEKTAKELIADVFFVPSEYWYDELKFLPDIKIHPKNKNIDSSVLNKTDVLLTEYIQQIKLCESKIDFLNSLLLRYENLLKKIEATVRKSLRLKNNDKTIKALKKYKKKLKTILNNNEDLHTIYEESEHLKIIRDEINDIEEDFSVQKEVNEYINKITSDFDGNNDNLNTEILREEIEKLNDEMKRSEDNDN